MLLSYLFENFLEEEQFAARCEISVEDLRDLYRKKVFPLPSYSYSAAGNLTSFFQPFQDRQAYRFHLKSLHSWYDDVTKLGLTDEASARAYFEARCEAAQNAFLAGTLGKRLCEQAPTVVPQFDSEHRQATWNHFLKGTFGVCTRDGLPETIFLKQSCVRFVETLTSDPEFGHKPDDLNLLRILVDLLDSVESDFAPHEVQQSSRQRCIIDVRQRYPAINTGC
ncbi:DUF6058 family natural product biosynthesis protein [Roseibium sp. SCPC15]|uniref:DUF6058 family natural product biosynthesis protein n=1 Tax=Roseibium sp. SCP15 TaxID=3141376 RepID=UPI003339EB98